MMGAPPRRGRPGFRGSPFRGNVANQVILEESSEGYENPTFGMRRHSGVPRGCENWQPPREEVEIPPTVSVIELSQNTSIDGRSLAEPESRTGVGLNTVRGCSIHNTWDHISAYSEKHQCEMAALNVPARKRYTMDPESFDLGEEVILRKLQWSAAKFMNQSSCALHRAEFEGSTEHDPVPGIPIIRVEFVDI